MSLQRILRNLESLSNALSLFQHKKLKVDAFKVFRAGRAFGKICYTQLTVFGYWGTDCLCMKLEKQAA
jgi:hypothetical protein